jgi:putative transposase
MWLPSSTCSPGAWWLVDECRNDGAARHRCAGDGDLARGKPDALLHHSDRGSQYTSEQFQRLMADNGVVCSMSRSGNVWDNAAMESFFSSLKTERTGNKTYRTRDEAKADVFDYIERFYNSKRRHSTIGYLSPMEFERQAGFA